MRKLIFTILVSIFTCGISPATEHVSSNASLTGIYATPCPFDLSMAQVDCSFVGVPSGSKIIIYDTSGRTVKELDGTVWNGRNASGDLVASGTYIYRVEAPDGAKFTGKLAVVK